MKLPPGPQTPALLQQLQWIFKSVEFLDECGKHYGDVFTVQVFDSKKIVFFSNPQAIQAIYTDAAKQFESGRENGIFSPVVGDSSVILLDGDRHQRQRQILLPPFHGERMRNYGKLIFDISQEVTNEWVIGKPFSIRPYMQEITLEVILRAVFGIQKGERFQQLKSLLKKLLLSISSPSYSVIFFLPALQRDLGAWSPWGNFLRQRQQIDRLIYAEISERRQQFDKSGTDILSLLMAARDVDGEPLTDIELRDELITLLLAGAENTVSALEWAFYWIHQQPQVYQSLMEELNQADDSEPSELAKLPYLTAICQETLRIYPIALVSLPRIVTLPIDLMGYQLEAGTLLYACIYLVHRREDIYPEHQKFIPERFLQRKFLPYEYMPFGGGNRGCIGSAFVLFEMKIVLASILSRWQLSLTNHLPQRPIRRGITTATASDVKMIATSKF
ncbi:cytochrome P450 [Cylindrospermum stagnale PCC 7417]|uniref:Cytochrome P450 n=1 Tax=Cylindrospermum stagnale PCC 7417 TaxID=56107 RepID=K9X340_9NOST|nr:cytochrome P450 [Cylindrospermum stagnale]AFZ26509.1 cytochrome P450 [Cylindrospermum stagnale PCC 7417]